MKSKDIRRDELTNRLSSFLWKEGKLNIKKVSGIKAHVLLMETQNNQKYILKRHKNREVLLQQWDFFKSIHNEFVIPFYPFPNGREFLSYRNNYFTIAPYTEGEKLNYKSAEDRKAAVYTIKNFHREARNIYLKRPVTRKHFLVKWHDRLLAFKQTEDLFYKHGFDFLFKDIVQTTAFQLQLLSQFPWKLLENRAQRNGTWVHGDVASHNLIQTAKQTFIIDFDLLHCTAQIYDFIQLGQRFLPYEKWEIEELTKYNMIPENQQKMWAYAVAVPSDIIREWLHFLNKKPADVSKYLTSLDQEWTYRQYFFKSIRKVLN